MLFALMVALTAAAVPYVPCSDDPARQAARSAELKAIHDGDQADRVDNVMAEGAQLRDRIRRMRVGEIFGEGCFSSAADYAHAAMVYQHGDQPDHYWQTFQWATRAVERGDLRQRRLMALGLDRFLVNTGRKQLFASQAFRIMSEPCWCLQPIEASFPEARRVELMGTTLAGQLAWVDTLNAGTSCPAARECVDPTLKATPAGTIPGFW